MGASQSSEISSFINSSVSATMNILNENVTNNHIECTTMNNMNIEFDNVKIKGGSISVGQTANVAVCDLTSAVSTATNNDLETKLTNTIDNMMEQSQKSTTGFLATSFTDQTSRQNFRASVKTAIQKTIRSSNISTCAASVTAVNNNTVVMKNINIEDGNINLTQEALVKASAKCIVDNIIQNIDKTAIDSIVTNKQSAKQSSEVRGFFESFGNLLQQMMIPLIILGVIVLIAGGGYLLLKGGGNNSHSQPPPMMFPQMFPQMSTPTPSSINSMIQSFTPRSS